MLHSAMPGAMQQPSMVDVKVTAMTPSTTEGSTTEVTRKSFFIKVVCEVSALLPVPNGNGQRARPGAPGYTPRYSRRIAGAEVEFHMGDMSRRSTKRAMRALKIIDENECINQ
jgi:hypothetical protein